MQELKVFFFASGYLREKEEKKKTQRNRIWVNVRMTSLLFTFAVESRLASLQLND